MNRSLVRMFTLLAVIGAALVASACTTDDWARLLYNTGKNTCERSRSQCDDHMDRGNRPPLPNLPSGAPRY